MHPLLLDGLLALVLTGIAVESLIGPMPATATMQETDLDFVPADADGVVLVLLQTLPLVWRRRAPLPVLGICGTAFLLYEALGYALPPVPVAVLVALYTVATKCPFSVSLAAVLTTVAAVSVGGFARGLTAQDDELATDLVALVAAGAMGYGMQLNRLRTEFLERQTQQLAREESLAAQLAVQHAQAGLARELHDIIAHNVSVIVAEARAARRVLHTRPEYACAAFDSIEGSGREALVEMRRLLAQLRTDQVAADYGPQPRLNQLPALIERVGRAGLSVRLSTSGLPRPLPPGIELNAYRIVQEALTNSLRHGSANSASVLVGYRPECLELCVSDDGRVGPDKALVGNGLLGMRQRVSLVGGELVAGPAAGGGFVVKAKLPVTAGAGGLS